MICFSGFELYSRWVPRPNQNKSLLYLTSENLMEDRSSMHKVNNMIGSLSIDDGDRNENGKKAIGLDQQNNNFARASRFGVHFPAIIARLLRESG